MGVRHRRNLNCKAETANPKSKQFSRTRYWRPLTLAQNLRSEPNSPSRRMRNPPHQKPTSPLSPAAQKANKSKALKSESNHCLCHHGTPDTYLQADGKGVIKKNKVKPGTQNPNRSFGIRESFDPEQGFLTFLRRSPSTQSSLSTAASSRERLARRAPGPPANARHSEIPIRPRPRPRLPANASTQNSPPVPVHRHGNSPTLRTESSPPVPQPSASTARRHDAVDASSSLKRFSGPRQRFLVNAPPKRKN